MSTEEKEKVFPQDQISIDKDKLKKEQKAELKAAIDAYEQRCLLSFSTNRSGEVNKKLIFLFFHSMMSHRRMTGLYI